ncbi:hypothetical protein CHARACLAT_011485 [Characodon lateralis]|uniref:Transmembrane protein n=1 Tax=Characodon lateralis TaxID=208331 RepID=A0ABU7F2I7_9TELE|nr:hypothetical protein [Characodon lateralis]
MTHSLHTVSLKPKTAGECWAASHIHFCNMAVKETSGFPSFILSALDAFNFTSSQSTLSFGRVPLFTILCAFLFSCSLFFLIKLPLHIATVGYVAAAAAADVAKD